MWELIRERWIGDSPAFLATCIRADKEYGLGEQQSFSIPAYMTLRSRDVLRLDWMRRDAWNLGRLG